MLVLPADQLGHWWETIRLIRKALPILLRDAFFVCDVLVILLSVTDTVMYWINDEASPLNSVALIRIIRLIRTARVFRLVRLLKELWLLIRSMVIAARTLLWTVCLLTVFIYIVSILMTDAYKDEAWAEHEWSTVGASMWNLLHLLTFDDWASRVRRVSDQSALYLGVLMAFTVVSALGVMNLVVGIMCQTAISVVADSRQRQFRLEMLWLMKSLTDMEKTAEGLDGDAYLDGAARMMSQDKVSVILHDPVIVKRLWNYGKMRPPDVWELFRKLDVFDTGSVSTDLFVEGMLRSRHPLQNEDLVVCSLMTNALRSSLVNMHQAVVKLNGEFQAAADTLKSRKVEWVREGFLVTGGHQSVSNSLVAEMFQNPHRGPRVWRRYIARETDLLASECGT